MLKGQELKIYASLRRSGMRAAHAIETARRNAGKIPTVYTGDSIWTDGPGIGAPFENGGKGGTLLRWIENPESCGLRLVGLAHDVAPANYSYSRPAVGHSGWFLDEYQHEKVAGVVYQLPARNGLPRYVVGYADPHNTDPDGRGPAALDLSDVFTGENGGVSWEFDPVKRDAACRADSIAERMAEQERDYQESYSHGIEARRLAQEAHNTGAAWLKACRESRAMWPHRAHALPGGLSMRALILDKIRTARAWREQYQEERDAARAYRDEYGNGRNCADFKEGYANG